MAEDPVAPGPLDPKSLLSDLNRAQREAVIACSGPVVIIAGAGTGKTRVISRRAAYAIATEVIGRDQVLIVTFTDKAAGEMVERLARLGLPGVTARTFHAQALSQLAYFWPQMHQGQGLPEILASKAAMLVPLIRELPGGYRFCTLKDIADEIEWAKARQIGPNHYEREIADHETPLPGRLMARLYADYERAKARAGKIDFDDMLIMTVELLEADSGARELVQSRKRWISVDEYQDTNPLQERLLRLWLGDSRDLCVVGDEDQTIYTFTGATSDYLTGFAARYEGAKVIDLMANYRSSPQILALANRLIAASGRTKRLEPIKPDGSEPEVLRLRDAEAELDMLARRATGFIAEGVSPSEIAILVRTNAQLAPIEQVLSRAGLPYVVRGGLFFARTDVRVALRLLRDRAPEGHGAALRRAIEHLWQQEAGYEPGVLPRGEEARARAAAFAMLLDIFSTSAKAKPKLALADYLAEIDNRAERERAGTGTGINLLTYHRAKGLEWDAVFLPSLEEGLLPIAQAIKRPSGLAEERRLLYVGITRARTHLVISHAETRLSVAGHPTRRLRSRFLESLAPPVNRPLLPLAEPRRARVTVEPARATSAIVPRGDALYDALAAWRSSRARTDGVPAYVVAPNETLIAIAADRPASTAALRRVRGMGESRLTKYGAEILAIVGKAKEGRG
jgi:DNA helicase-2/ATP-dependent DNA helicase PcrA